MDYIYFHPSETMRRCVRLSVSRPESIVRPEIVGKWYGTRCDKLASAHRHRFIHSTKQIDHLQREIAFLTTLFMTWLECGVAYSKCITITVLYALCASLSRLLGEVWVSTCLRQTDLRLIRGYVKTASKPYRSLVSSLWQSKWIRHCMQRCREIQLMPRTAIWIV